MMRSPFLSGFATLLLVAGLAQAATEKLPAKAKLTKIEASPAKIALGNKFTYAQLVLTGTLANGDKIDVTRMVTFEVPGTLVKVSATGQVRPVGDGKGTLKATLAGQSVSVPVAV